MSKIDRITRLERIKRAIDEDNDAFLSDAERTEKMELLTVCSLLLNPYKTTQSIVQILLNEHGLEERQAFQRIKDAKFVFGNVFSADRALERMKAYQRAELAWKLALEAGEVDAMTRANEQMIKIVGADDPNDQFDPTKMEPSVYKAVLPPTERKALQLLMNNGAVDLAAMLEKAGLLQDAVIVPEPEVQDEDATDQEAHP